MSEPHGAKVGTVTVVCASRTAANRARRVAAAVAALRPRPLSQFEAISLIALSERSAGLSARAVAEKFLARGK
jgi:hypothetical protein